MKMIHTDTKVEISINQHDCLVVGNPRIPPFIHDDTQWNLGRLPYAELEALQVSNTLNVTPLVREHATKQEVLYRIRKTKIIHIATHGSGSAGFLAFSSSFPLSKEGYAKAEDILIYPSDIEALNISPALVVLSSSQANQGNSSSDGVMGMAGAFLCAGAQCVLVSSFSVADESTCVFMELFYQFLMDGFTSSHALQKSTQCMRCMSKFSEYNHWAGFQIVGEDISISQKTDHNPILNTKLLGEMSIFPRENMQDIKHGLQNNNTNKVQLLMGLTGTEPEECVKDYITKYYHLYSRGVYWFNATDELILGASVKLANMAQTCKNELINGRGKRLVVIDNFSRNTKIGHLIYIDNKTDIILTSNNTVDEHDIQHYIKEICSRSVNIIRVKSLVTTEVLKRITYSLIKSRTFSPKDSHVHLFNKLSDITMGTTTLTNIVTALLAKHNIDEVAMKVNHCIKLLAIGKELHKGSPTMLLTCSALIKSIVTPETQMLLNSLSMLGIHGIPIPFFIIKEVEKLIISDPLKPEGCCFEELKDFSIIHKYPYPCVLGNTQRIGGLPEQYIKFYYIPKLTCVAVWEQNEEAEHILNTLMLLKAIELYISEDASDKIKLELMFEILTILYNHSDKSELLLKCMHLRMKIAYIVHCHQI